MSESDVLSKAEVGALLTGVEDGIVPTNGGVAASGEISAYEYKSSANVSSYCPISLVNIYGRAARQMQDSLHGILKRKVTVELDSVRRLRYDEYIATLDNPICIYTITEQSLPGTALIVLDSRLVYGFVDNYFGGAGGDSQESDDTDRHITPSEVVMSRKLLDLLLEKLTVSWSKVVELGFTFSGFETNPAMVTVAAPSALMIVATLNVELAGSKTTCHIVMPINMLAPVQPLLEASGQGSLAKREQFQHAMRESLNRVSVDLHSTLCEVHLTLRELLSLLPGDVIPIDLPSSVELCANEQAVFVGGYGRSRGQDAIRIDRRAMDVKPQPKQGATS